ncbi:MAG: hypothetical protein QOG51_1924 [Verrucomicrobiota bacterium]
MAARSMLTPDLARPRDLESFRDGFPGFAARDRFRHKARKIAQSRSVTTGFEVECASRASSVAAALWAA